MKYSNKIIQSRKENVYRKIIDRAPEGYLLNENTLETMEKILNPLILSTADDPSVDFFLPKHFEGDIMPSVATVMLTSKKLVFDSPEKLALLAASVKSMTIGCTFEAARENCVQISIDIPGSYVSFQK